MTWIPEFLGLLHDVAEHLKHPKSASADVLIVSVADKLHNSRDTLAHINREGITTLDRFNVEPE